MKQKTVKACMIFLLSGVVAVACGGCDERLRKKFVREKNLDKKNEDLDVVYQPVEYSPEFFDVGQQYEHHFHLWKAWHTDLKNAVESGDSVKRKQYLLDHEIDALRSMQYWVTAEKQKDFDDMIAELLKVDAEFRKSEMMQNNQLVSRSLDIIQNKIQGEYDLGHVKDSLIQK